MLASLKSRPKFASFDSLLIGTICGLMAAIGYTATNVFLRSVISADPYWASCMKSLPTVLLIGPMLVVRATRNQQVLPRPRILLLIIGAALLGQTAGNVVFQWALGIIGIALAVPIVMGTIILAGAALGKLLLGEHVTRRAAASILLLILAVITLSLGAPSANESITGNSTASPLIVTAGIAAAVISGIAYALLGVAIRYGVTGKASVETTVFVVGLVGLVVLGTISWSRIGWQGMAATPTISLIYMILAGIANAGAFFALTKAMQVANITYVNLLNSSQAAMCAAAGVLLFNEPLSAGLGVGVVFTIVGIGIMRRFPSSSSALQTESVSKGPESPPRPHLPSDIPRRTPHSNGDLENVEDDTACKVGR